MQEENKEYLEKNGESAVNESNNEISSDGIGNGNSGSSDVKDIIDKISEISDEKADVAEESEALNVRLSEACEYNADISETKVSLETRDDTAGISESNEPIEETQKLEGGAADNSSVVNNGNISENKNEENETLEYATMPGSWASYEAERNQVGQYSNVRGNGVYPEDGNVKGNVTYPENGSGRINGGSYFGMGDNGSFYGQGLWQGSYQGGAQNKPKDKKKIILFAAIGTVALALIVAAVIGVFQIINRLSDDLGGNILPPSGGQISGGTEGGGSSQQPGSGTQSGGSSSGTANANKEHLQNGGFTLEQVTAEEHYKLSDVYKAVEGTVVAIKSTIGSGSGVIISKDEVKNDGYYIVTNNHVIEGAENIKVTLSSGAEYGAILIGRDEATDLAVLKIIASDLTVVPIGKSEDMVVAEEVLVIGNPLGMLGGTATNGIISAKNRTLTIDGYTMSLLQTNAAINNGNSGGGMFNMSGQLVGVVNAKFVDEAVEGIGFAIPIDTAKPIIEDIINYGYVKGRPDLGFKVAYSRWDNAYYASEVKTGSEAEKAGLKANDIIGGFSVNGDNFTEEEFLAYIKAPKIGDYVVVTVYRYSGYSTYETQVSFTVTEYQG